MKSGHDCLSCHRFEHLRSTYCVHKELYLNHVKNLTHLYTLGAEDLGSRVEILVRLLVTSRKVVVFPRKARTT